MPAAVALSARPRWSHRDPVEGGNPFPVADPRRGRWQAATDLALERLARHDAMLALAAEITLDPSRYRAQMLDLAVSRFDTWAERGAAVVADRASARGYADWLHRYVRNWLAYAADTCPRVDLRDALEQRLRARAEHWETRGLIMDRWFTT